MRATDAPIVAGAGVTTPGTTTYLTNGTLTRILRTLEAQPVVAPLMEAPMSSTKINNYMLVLRQKDCVHTSPVFCIDEGGGDVCYEYESVSKKFIGHIPTEYPLGWAQNVLLFLQKTKGSSKAIKYAKKLVKILEGPAIAWGHNE